MMLELVDYIFSKLGTAAEQNTAVPNSLGCTGVHTYMYMRRKRTPPAHTVSV